MENKIIVETSARHLHVTQNTLEVLFGAGALLHKKKDLSQPGEFASEEKVTVIGPRGQLTATILGPCRKADQVELSLTDARTLGLNIPVRESGNVSGTPGLKLVGPAGEVDLKEGVIAAKRHIHMTPEDAAAFGVENGQEVGLKLSTERPLIFYGVVVRVSPKYRLAAHIDTDESNAAAAAGVIYGELVK